MSYKFIDLFAGIGGFHLAFAELGAECVFASEWDSNARKTYIENFSPESPELFENGNFAGDITKVDKHLIPDFDILTAGFPCQPFSQAGKRNGFEDTRGTLFFEIAEIIRVKQPAAFFLENVRHLLNHDGGATMGTIRRVIEEELGYSLQVFSVKASEHGLPQLRPRLYMIGFRDETLSLKQPPRRPLQLTMSDVLGEAAEREIGYTLRVGGRSSGIADRRNWDSYKAGGRVVRINSEHGKLMQGFPKNFKFPVPESAAMKQLGNSVAVWAVRDYAEAIINTLQEARSADERQ
jgi:DNA (cytosine-5)-methyltransferase 1